MENPLGTKQKIPYDLTGKLMDYEDGRLDANQTIELFQELVNTGVVWQLQGAYGRLAAQLIERGLVTQKSQKKAA